jgi:hypothetical protein
VEAARAMSVTVPSQPIAPLAADDEEERARAASSAERTDFLNNSIVFAESNIRAFDTKSQIALAAFVFSMSPLWSILNATCPNAASRPIIAVLLAAFIWTIMLYGYVLWPIRPRQNLVKNKRVKGLFFLADPMAVSATYAEELKKISLEAELTGEVLKLSFIRASKGRRFRYALWATAGFYILVFVSFLVLQRCA